MDRAQQPRNQPEERAPVRDDNGQAPGRTSDGDQGVFAGERSAVGQGEASDVKRAGAWSASPGLMGAMGLEAAGGDGDKPEGITTPPKGKASGIATPDIKKMLEDKTHSMQKAGIPAPPSSGELGSRSAAKSAPPGGGEGTGANGAAKTSTPAHGARYGGSTAGGGASKSVEAGGAHTMFGGDHDNTQAPGTSAGAPPAPAGKQPALGGASSGDGTLPVDALIAELEHGPDSTARIKAAQQLARSTSPKARQALERATSDRDITVAKAARKALEQLGLAR